MLLLHYSSVITLFLQYLLTPNIIPTVINYVAVNLLHWQELKFEQPGVVEIMAVIIIILAYFNVTTKIFTNWKGGKSVEEVENSYGKGNYYIVQESYQYLTNPNSRILVQQENDDQEISMSYEQMEVENLVWHVQVAELLKLKDAQYKIDIDNHWYKQENCYIT